MRIISQDMCTNIPYEMVTIKLRDEENGRGHLTGRIEILAWSLCNSDIYKLGTYTDVLQAEDVMEDIVIHAYENSNPNNFYNMPKDEGEDYGKNKRKRVE